VLYGTTVTYQNGTTISGTDLQNTYSNGTSYASGWVSGQTAFNPLNLYGVLNLLGTVSAILQNVQLLIIGFPTFLDWIRNTFIQDATGQAAFLIIETALIGIEGLLGFLWFIEFVSGRNTTVD
jgi:hypothetical protein